MALDPVLQGVLDDLGGIFRDFDSVANGAEDDLLRAFRQAQKRAFSRIEKIILDSPDLARLSRDQRLAYYLEQSASLESAVVKAYPRSALNRYLSKYKDYARFAERQLEVGGRVPAQFTRIPDKFVEFLKQRDRNHFSFLNRQGLERLDQAFLQNVIVGVKRSSLLADLKGIITGSYSWGETRGLYEWHAGTYVRTAAMRSGRLFHTAQAREAGLTKYLYVGPLDGKTRSFCRGLVGTVHSETDIEQMDNGQTGLVLSDGGGFNCRHTWNAVSNEFAKDIEANAAEAKETILGPIPAET